MANLEVQIGADSSEFNSEISKVERQLQTLERRQELRIRAGLDTGDLDTRISSARANLARLRVSLNDVGRAAQGTQRPMANAGNTLTNFSRIAQDAPFGIMGIGNNLTATAEAFSSLSRQAGGAGNALRAVAGSLMGGGGILLAISLVTTGLTMMSQKGLTVGDVFNKLTGNFDEFKKSLQEVNKEAAKNAAEQVASVGAYVSAAKDINLSMQERLIAVKKLQDEYPLFFGNLTKEQILNGDVANAVNEVVKALKAKARAQAYAGKLGDLAAKEVELREKETKKIEEGEALIRKINEEKKKGSKFSIFGNQLEIAKANLKAVKAGLADVQDEIRANMSEMDKWAAKSTIEVKASIKLDFKEEKGKKEKKIKELHSQISQVPTLQTMGLIMPKGGIFDPLTEGMTKSREAFIARLQSSATLMSQALIDFNKGLKDVMMSGVMDTFGSMGEAIGTALANGTSVVESVGRSLIGSMGSILSAIGDKLIALGAASLLASTVFSTFGTALGVGAALAAIAGGVALKAGGAFMSTKAKGGSGGGNSQISAGNSVSAPTSSTNYSGGSSGFQNVVFEISGQSLVGVLSNTLNKNVKLGGAPAI